MVVVTISMLDIQPLSEEIPQEVRNVVLLQPEEPVLSEVAERSYRRMTEEPKLAFSFLIFFWVRQDNAKQDFKAISTILLALDNSA